MGIEFFMAYLTDKYCLMKIFVGLNARFLAGFYHAENNFAQP